VKPDDVSKWRHEIRTDFANGHAGYVGSCLKNSDKKGVKRHLGLIWDWAPDFEPPKDFLLADLKEVDASTASLLEDLMGSVKGELRKTLGKLVGGYWNGKAVQTANQGAMLNGQSVDAANKAGVLAQNMGRLGLGGQGMAILIKELLRQAKNSADQARDKANEARGYIRKAKQFSPDDPTVKENYDTIEKLCGTTKEN